MCQLRLHCRGFRGGYESFYIVLVYYFTADAYLGLAVHEIDQFVELFLIVGGELGAEICDGFTLVDVTLDVLEFCEQFSCGIVAAETMLQSVDERRDKG
jgi:hypothetical protein